MSESAGVATSAPESEASSAGVPGALALATVLSAIAVIPATLRGGVNVGLVGLGAAALSVGLFAASFKVVGVRSRAVGTVLFAVALSSAPLAILARVLKATTHHRPLGGVTFAILALVVLGGALAVGARLLTFRRWIPIAVGALGAVAGLRFALPALGASFLDGVLLLAAGLDAALITPPGWTRRAGVPVWAVVVVLGVALCFAMPSAASTAAERAPVVIAPFSPFIR